MRFTKLQGLGNDFVLIDGREQNLDWPSLAREICRPHYGIGADGLLLLADPKSAPYRMRVFNPDGSESEACGNGLRCFVRYLFDFVEKGADSFEVETYAGVRTARMVPSGNEHLVKVSMGKPVFNPELIPVNASPNVGKLFESMLGEYPLEVDDKILKLCFVSMGNPHAVYFSDTSADTFPLKEIGPLVEKNPLFPKGVNLEVARLLDSNLFEARVWERGTGITLACGSGACAIAVAAQLKGLCGPSCDVRLPGGIAHIDWVKGQEVFLTGPAVTVFSGDWDIK